MSKAAHDHDILDKYIQAAGGAERLAKLTSFAAKGTFQGYQDEKYPVDVFVKTPNQISTIVHTAAGDSATTYDGAQLRSRDHPRNARLHRSNSQAALLPESS